MSTVEQQPDSAQLTPLAAGLPPLRADLVGGVSLAEVVREAFDSLFANKGRSILTMLGVIIGVASVVSLMALGSGANASVTSQVQSMGTNLIFIVPHVPRSAGAGSTGAPQSLTLDDATAIAALNLPVSGIAPEFSGSAPIVAPAADKYTQVIGTTSDYFALNDLQLAGGSFFSPLQERAGEAVAVLGADLARDLFGSGQTVGQLVRIKSEPVRVLGVLAPKGGSGGMGSVDNRAIVPIMFAQQRLFGARTPDGNSYQVATITLSAEKADDITAIQNRIAVLLRERHNLNPDGSEDDFLIINQESFLAVLNNITNMLTTFLAAIAGISLVVGGIGIMNIMLVSVTERTKEIGLRKAVGARSRDIMLQFVVEALVISVLGGLLGLALGTLVAQVITLTGLLEASISLGAVAMAVGFSTAVGLFFGIYPASRAARLDPIDALRYE